MGFVGLKFTEVNLPPLTWDQVRWLNETIGGASSAVPNASYVDDGKPFCSWFPASTFKH